MRSKCSAQFLGSHFRPFHTEGSEQYNEARCGRYLLYKRPYVFPPLRKIHTSVVRGLHRHRKGVGLIRAGGIYS